MKHPKFLVPSQSSGHGIWRLGRRPRRMVGTSTAAAVMCVGSFGLASLALAQSAATESIQTRAPESDVSDAPELTASVAAGVDAAPADLLRQMTTTGIALTADVSYTLAEPTFVSITGEPIDPAMARQSLTQIAGPQGVPRFTRNSVVAPLAVRTDAISDAAGQRIGHCIDVTFVVHQSIAEIRQSKVLDNFKSEPDADVEGESVTFADGDTADEFETTMTRSLTPAELSQYGVIVDKDSEALGYLQLPLLGKVVLRGVARARRSVWSSEDPSAPVILTWLLDSRFGSETPRADSIANQWRAIETTEVGQRVLGPPHRYQGLGGYVAISPLPGDAAASIVQIRFILHEPAGWFHGGNQLRSKLPLLIQDRVRHIRRELQD